MPLKFKPGPYDTVVDPESLTEQEHVDSCDINKMLRSAINGHDIRMRNPGSYGYDDTTMDAVQFRVEKQRLEEELGKTASEHEFEEHELAHIPDQVQKKFGFKKKAKKQTAKNDKPNDDKKPSETSPPQEAKTDDGQGS